MSHNKYISPDLFVGLQYQTQCSIRSRTCYETGELSIMIESVCKMSNISIEDLRHSNRRADLSDARKIFFHLARRLYLFTNEKLGRYLRRDHSTVVVAVQRCEIFLASDPSFKELYVNTLLETIRNLKIHGYENYKNTHKQIVLMAEVMKLNKIRNEYRSDYDVRS